MRTTYTVIIKHMPSGRIMRLLVLSTNPAQAIVAVNAALNTSNRTLSACEFIAFGAEVAA